VSPPLNALFIRPSLQQGVHQSIELGIRLRRSKMNHRPSFFQAPKRKAPVPTRALPRSIPLPSGPPGKALGGPPIARKNPGFQRSWFLGSFLHGKPRHLHLPSPPPPLFANSTSSRTKIFGAKNAGQRPGRKLPGQQPPFGGNSMTLLKVQS